MIRLLGKLWDWILGKKKNPESEAPLPPPRMIKAISRDDGRKKAKEKREMKNRKRLRNWTGARQ